MPRIIVFFLALFLFIATKAQESKNELDPVTISASMTPNQQSKTGRNIIVVDGEALRKYPVNSVDELLRYLPGIEVQSRGPMGTQSNITLRGGTFQQVLIVIDGMRINDPLTGHFNSYFPISPEEIDRIEILKGASSAVYGTEAVGGVIHIITKTFSGIKNKKYRSVSAQLTSGQYGLRNGQAGFTVQQNKTIVSGGLLQNYAEGQALRGTKGFFNLSTVSLSAKHFFNDHLSLAYRTAYDDRNFNAQNFYTQLISDTATERVISRWHQFSAQYKKGKHNIQLSGAYKDASDKFQLRKSSASNTNRSSMAQLLLLHQYRLNDNSSFQTGLQWINREVKSNNRGNHRISTAGVFILLHKQIGDNLHINPSVRTDWNERSGWELIPQLNLSYKLKQIQLRGSVGKTTREPDFTERFNNYQPLLVSAGNRIGNPFLEAETSLSYEGGIDYFGIKGLKISAGWFQRFHSGLIDYILTGYNDMPRQVNLVPGASYSLAKNISRVNTRGAELDLLYQKKISENQTLVLQIGAVRMKSLSSDTVPSLYVSNHASFLLNFSLLYQYRNFSISTNGLYKERLPQTRTGFVAISPSYYIMNLRIEYSFSDKQVSAFAQADNLLNHRYADILGTVMPSRWLMGGIKISL
jgi:iron complex outermembrane receptor protein